MPRELPRQPTDDRNTKEATDALIALSQVATKFARIRRAPRYQDSVHESDVEHSYHLSLSATELAATYFPELDAGLVAQFSLVHDLPELYAGDVPTLNISEAERTTKEDNEKQALARLLSELPPHTAQLLMRYEEQVELEARFVRFVDKLMPQLIITVTESNKALNKELGITSVEHLRDIREQESARLEAMFPEFPFIQRLRTILVEAIDSDSGLEFAGANSD